MKLTEKCKSLQLEKQKRDIRIFLLGLEIMRLNEANKNNKNNTKPINKSPSSKRMGPLDSQPKSNNSDMLNKLRQKELEILHLKEEASDWNLREERMSAHIQNLKRELKEATKSETNRGQYIDRLKDLKQDFIRLKDDNEFYRKEVQRQKEERRKDPKQAILLRQDVNRLKKELVEVGKERDRAYERLMNDHQILTKKLENERLKSREANKEVAQMRSINSNFEESIRILRRENAQARSSVNEIQARLKEAEDEVKGKNSLVKQMSHVVKELEEYKRQHNTLERDYEQRDKELEDIWQERSQLRRESNDYKHQVEILKMENEDLLQELERNNSYIVDTQDYSKNSIKHFLLALEIHRLNEVVKNLCLDKTKLKKKLLNKYGPESGQESEISSVSPQRTLIVPNLGKENKKFSNKDRSNPRNLNSLFERNQNSKSPAARKSHRNSFVEHDPKLDDLEIKLKLSKAENKRLDEALTLKMSEIERLKNTVQTNRRNGSVSKRGSKRFQKSPNSRSRSKDFRR